MTKNIEIQIKDKTYEKLKSESVQYDIDLESYISVLLEKKDYTIKQNNNYIEEKVKKPLKQILTDLEGLSNNIKNNSSFNKVLLLPLKLYSKPLPKGFSKLIERYKSKGWYNVERFYLITDGKSILGYLGLNISEEDAPYGRYLFIYGLNLYKEHQNRTNLNYITNFVKSIARQGQCYSMDILYENTNLTYDQLKELGFVLFTSTDILKIKDEENNDKINSKYFKSENYKIEDIDGFLPVARVEPFKPLFSQWIERKEEIEVCRNIYKDENEEIEFIYIKENKSINNIIYSWYTVLIKSECLYEDKYIIKVLSILKSIVFKSIDDGKISIVVPIPSDINENLSMYSEDDILDSLHWLRKNNS